MNINRIIGRNFKGQHFDIATGPVTVITGDNFAGKTTLADAVRLALAGYIPGVGKTSPHIWQALAGDPEAEGTMEVEVAFNTGRVSKLTFARSKKGQVSQEGAVPADLALDPMLLDVRAFFRLTAQERTAAIFAAAGEVGLTAEKVADALWKVEASPVTERDRVVRELITESEKAFKAKASAQEAVEKLLNGWKDTLKGVRARAKVAEGAFAGMKLPLKIPQPMEGLSDAKLVRDTLLVSRAQLTALLRDDQRVAQLEVAVKTRQAAVEAYRANVDAANAALSEAEEPGDPPAMPTVLIEYEATKPEAASLEERVRVLRAEVERLDGELEAIKGVTLCPCCGVEGGMETARKRLTLRIQEATLSMGEAVAALETLLEPFADVGQVAAEFSGRQQEHADAVAAVKTRKKELDEAQAVLDAAQASLESGRAELERLQWDRSARIAELTKEVEKLPEIETRILDLEQQGQEFNAYQKLLTDRSDREKEVLTLTCEAAVLDGAVKAVSALVGKLSEEAFGRVLQLSDAFTAGLINSPLKFRDGELGREVSATDQAMGRKAPLGAWISHTSFSGTEDLLAMAGFAVALARLAPFKLFILDEMGRLTPERRIAVAQRVTKLVADGVIDQAMLIDAGADRKAYKAKGLTLVER